MIALASVKRRRFGKIAITDGRAIVLFAVSQNRDVIARQSVDKEAVKPFFEHGIHKRSPRSFFSLLYTQRDKKSSLRGTSVIRKP